MRRHDAARARTARDAERLGYSTGAAYVTKCTARMMRLCCCLSPLLLPRHLVRCAQHLANDADALPILRRAPVNARVLPDVQVAILELFVYALLVARPHHSAKRAREGRG